MLKRSYKLIICVVFVATLFIGFGSAFASADPVWLLRAKAGLASAALAAQLILQPASYGLSYGLQQAVDPLGIVQTVQETEFAEYLDRSVIKVYPDVVTVDGVPYSDIWLGPEAADKLRTNLGDFITAYNIRPGQSSAISYASGAGYVYGLPVYLVDGYYRSQKMAVPFSEGIVSYGFGLGTAYSRQYNQTTQYYVGFSNDQQNITWSNRFSTSPQYIGIFGGTLFSSNWYVRTNDRTGTALFNVSTYAPTSIIESPFSFDYTSGSEILTPTSEDGLLIRVPSEHSGSTSQDTYSIPDFVQDNPRVSAPDGGTTINIDPDINPDFQADIDLSNDLGDLLDIILNVLDLLDDKTFEFAPYPDEPTPEPEPPLPDPDVPIGDQDPTWLDNLLRWIQQTIDTVKSVGEDIQQSIQDLLQELQQLPENILEDIETGPSKVFRKALDVLKSLFLPLLLPIKAMMGLWHYVVEWIQSISSPFSWIFGIMSGTSANMVLPIYAVLAGSICIAIYKALGR